MADPSQRLSDDVKRQMNQPQIHDAWEKSYRTAENERFFEEAYDAFTRRIALPAGARALDIGCGICANSVRLARRGFVVSAADYSEAILPRAHENVARHGLAERISIGREDILDLSFPGDTFDLVLCWGVLMHIPDAEGALRELTRVARPGGYLVFEELNVHAPEARLMRAGWSAFKKHITLTKTAAGIEHSCQFEGETLFWRHTDPRWLIAELARHSCHLVRRDSGLCSEMYSYAPGRLLKGAVNAWNRLWFRHLNMPRLAFHNIYIFRKQGGPGRPSAAPSRWRRPRRGRRRRAVH